MFRPLADFRSSSDCIYQHLAMSGNSYTLQWKQISNITSTFADVFTENKFTDVTLVSEDKIPIQAHRYVLSVFSPVLKNILLDNPHPHPLIYLRGVNHQEMYSILHFIYHGEVSVNQRNMDRFAQAAKDLQIKKLAGDIKMEIMVKPVADLVNNYDSKVSDDQADYKSSKESVDEIGSAKYLHKCEECKTRYISESALDLHNSRKHKREDNLENKDIHPSCKNQAEFEHPGTSSTNNEEKISSLSIPLKDRTGSDHSLYKCEECQSRYKSRSALVLHTSRKHGGLVFFCNYCEYEATTKGDKNKHEKSIHEFVRYPCGQCDYQATTQSHLKRHQNSVHEGVRYYCNQCEYTATTQGYLKEHKKSFHEGVKYSCDLCDFRTGRKYSIKGHKDRMHSSSKLCA